MNTYHADHLNLNPDHFSPGLRDQKRLARPQRQACFQSRSVNIQSAPPGMPRLWRAVRGAGAARLAAGLLSLGLLGTVNLATAAPLDSWQNRTPITNTNALLSVVYGNGRFVAVGYAGTVLYSTDGATWNTAPKVTTKDLNAVTYGNGLFVAGGEDRIILTSTDGVAWTAYPGSLIASLFCGTYGNGKFMFAGTSQIVESTGGGTWFPHTQPFPEVLDGLAFGNGKFVGVGSDYDTYAPVIYTSADGTGWTPRNPQITQSLSGIAFGGGLFVATGDAGALITSPDGESWTPRSIATTSTLWDVDHGNNTFVTVGWAGAIFSSTNGVNWTPHASGTANALYSVAFGNGAFVAVGRYGTILQSAPLGSGNGSGGVPISQPIRSGNNFSFQFNGNVGETYLVQASTNLINWTTLTSLVCTNPTTGCSLAGQTMPSRFYRVVKP